jgi:hypothetical protein
MTGAEIKKEQTTESRKSASFFIVILLIAPIEPGGSTAKMAPTAGKTTYPKYPLQAKLSQYLNSQLRFTISPVSLLSFPSS